MDCSSWVRMLPSTFSWWYRLSLVLPRSFSQQLMLFVIFFRQCSYSRSKLNSFEGTSGLPWPFSRSGTSRVIFFMNSTFFDTRSSISCLRLAGFGSDLILSFRDSIISAQFMLVLDCSKAGLSTGPFLTLLWFSEPSRMLEYECTILSSPAVCSYLPSPLIPLLLPPLLSGWAFQRSYLPGLLLFLGQC